MWVVKGETISGKVVEYRVPTGKDTEKAFVMALAFQEHGKENPEDALTTNVTVTWTSDNVLTLPNGGITIAQRSNFAVDMRVSKGLWERHSPRAFRTLESATEALESAASEYPNEKFRIVETMAQSRVVAQSKNVLEGEVNEEPEKTEEAKPEAPTLPEDNGSDPKPESKPKPNAKAKAA